jgi:hypothetical protein
MSGTVQCQEARGVRCRMPMTHRVNRQQDRTNWSRIGYFRWPSIRAKALSRTKVMNLVTNLLRHPRRTYFSAVRDTRAKYDADLFFFVEPRGREEIATFPEDQCVAQRQPFLVSSEVPQFWGNRRADIAEQIFRENTARQKTPSPVPDEIRDSILPPGTTAMAQDFST